MATALHAVNHCPPPLRRHILLLVRDQRPTRSSNRALCRGAAPDAGGGKSLLTVPPQSRHGKRAPFGVLVWRGVDGADAGARAHLGVGGGR